MAKLKKVNLDQELGDLNAKDWLLKGIADSLNDDKSAAKASAMSSLYAFSNEVMAYPRIQGGLPNGISINPHLEVCDFIESPNKRYKLLLLPRGAFKSALVHGYVLQRIVKNRNIRILYVSESFTNATAHLKEIKDHIETNEKFIELFGDIKGKKWTEAEIEVKRHVPYKEGTITAAGIEVVKVGMHYDIIILDDPHSEQNVTTRDQIQKVVSHYKHLFSILEPKGELIVIGTRWHFNDLYGQIMEDKETSDKFSIMKRSAFNHDGTSFYPTIHSVESLEELRILKGSTFFANQYLNEPIDDASATFKREYLRYWDKDETHAGFSKGDVAPLPPNLMRFTLVDPATPGEDHDFSAIVTVGMSKDRKIYVLRAEQGRWETSYLINRIFNAVKEDNPRLVGVEKAGFQALLITNIAEEKKKRNIWFQTKPLLPGKRSKASRIGVYGLQPRFEAGLVYLRSDMRELEDQILRFPKLTNDDLLDALAYCLDVAQFPTTDFFQRERTSYLGAEGRSYLKPRNHY